MINHNKVFVLIALGAMAYWCNPVQAQESVLVLMDEKAPYDIIGPQEEGEEDTSSTGGDTTVGTTYVQPAVGKKAINIYPNPATTYFFIDLNLVDQAEVFELVSLSGKRVLTFQAREKVSTLMFESGVYFIRPKNTALPYRSTKIVIGH